MRMGRWFGSLVVLTGVMFLAVAAHGQQDKDKTPEKDGKDKEKVEPPKIVPPALGGGGDKLDFKAFSKKGNVFYQELTTDTKQTMKVMGQEVKQDQKQTFYIEWTVGEPQGKNWVVTQKIIGVKMDINIGGNKIAYDSTDDKAPKNPMTDFFEALKQADLKLTIDSDTLKVTKIDGAETLIDKLSSTNPQLQPLLKSILSEAALKQMAEPTWGAVPTSPKKKGEDWKKEYTLDLGGIGTYDTKYTYILASDDAKVAKIDIKADLTYKAPPGDRRTLPFEIKSADLTGKTTGDKNEAIFDKEKGRIESSTVSMELKGKMDIAISGQTTTVELNQTQTSTVATTDANPLAKAAPPKKS